MPEFVNNAIFWIEVEKIKPNPYQPRKEFDPHHLQDLSDSIRQYGVLQPLVVTRKEVELPEGGMQVEYELIAGERRLRASKLAGLLRVPAIIQAVTDPRLKLELAIIENLQREDLNPVDRALSFARLAQEFNLKHTEIAKKVGKSREYVSNTLRLLVLPQEILDTLAQGRITEGHARPLMMLSDRKDEQTTLFKEIMFKKLTVREAEQIARHIAKDKVRKKIAPDPEIEMIEKELAESLGTRVSIERRPVGGGKLVIDFFSSEDLRALLDKVHITEQLAHLRSAKAQIGEASGETRLSESTPLHVTTTAALAGATASLTATSVHRDIADTMHSNFTLPPNESRNQMLNETPEYDTPVEDVLSRNEPIDDIARPSASASHEALSGNTQVDSTDDFASLSTDDDNEDDALYRVSNFEI